MHAFSKGPGVRAGSSRSGSLGHRAVHAFFNDACAVFGQIRTGAGGLVGHAAQGFTLRPTERGCR